MIVLAARIDAELLEHISAEGILGEHSLDRLVHGELGLLVHEFLVLHFFKAADVAGVIAVILLFELLAGEDHLVAVDDDDMVAAVDVGGVFGLVLPFENSRHLRSKTSEHHIGGVDDVPLALHFAGFRHVRLIVVCHCGQILSHYRPPKFRM